MGWREGWSVSRSVTLAPPEQGPRRALAGALESANQAVRCRQWVEGGLGLTGNAELGCVPFHRPSAGPFLLRVKRGVLPTVS